MKVFITSTPEVESSLLSEVITILQNQKGELEFLGIDSLTFEEVIKQLREYKQCKSIDEISRLTFSDFYTLCNIPRLKDVKINDDDFVVLLTNIDNEMSKDEQDESNKDWFSAFSDRDIFIYTKDWKELTYKSAQFAVSFQIVENIFQSLINLDIKNWQENPHIHKKPIGCINDMCDDPSEVIYKLHAGYICDKCFNEALKKNVSGNTLLQIFKLLQDIRNEFINLAAISKVIKPYKLIINPKKIIIGDTEIKLTKVEETLFRFFLNHPEGVQSLSEKQEYNQELFNTYYHLKKGKPFNSILDPAGVKFIDIRKTIDTLCDENYIMSTFSKVKSTLKTSLKEQLGVNYYDFYIIKDFDNEGKENNKPGRSDHNYRITLEQTYIENNIKK